MNDLLRRRREMMGQKTEEEELYPIGTDIVSKYIGRDPITLYAYFNAGYSMSNKGVYESWEGNRAASPIYMEINPSYRYQKTAIAEGKNAGRILNLCYYDKNYNFISYVTHNDLQVVNLAPPPRNAKYARLTTHSVQANWTIAIVRIS